MFCQNCGNKLEENAVICTNCGASVVKENFDHSNDNKVNIDKEPSEQSQARFDRVENDSAIPPHQAAANRPVATEDKPNILVNILSLCCIPILGIVMFFVWKDSHPRAAKSALIFSLINIGIGVVFYLLIFVFGIFAGVVDSGTDY